MIATETYLSTPHASALFAAAACLALSSSCGGPAQPTPLTQEQRWAQALGAARRAPARALPLPEARPVWPAQAKTVNVLTSTAPKRRLKVLIDPGHGAPGNTGNWGSFCRDEQDTMLVLGLDLATVLRTRGYEVRLSRQDTNSRPRYQRRVREAAAWKADLLISLHSDIRGSPRWWTTHSKQCLFSDLAPGFAVLYADNPPARRLTGRVQLARLLAAKLSDAGFLAYDGWDYTGLYESDAKVAGAFIDRHLPGARIYMLRHPPMPSVIIETYNARHRLESMRFDRIRTRRAFFAAVAAALSDYAAHPRPAASGPTKNHATAASESSARSS